MDARCLDAAALIVSVNFDEIFTFKEEQIRTQRAFIRRRDFFFLFVLFLPPWGFSQI